MIQRKLEDIHEADLEGLVANSVPEGKTIDYKKTLPGNADGDKKEFLADVSSFANAAGGDLIFGVDEAQGVPTALPGLVLQDQDAELRRLDSIISDGIDPRLKHGIRIVPQNGKLPVLIIRTERSWIGPHRVTFKGHDKFYGRNSAGKYPMDVSELRSTFTLAISAAERIRQFRADRIARVQSGQTPVPFPKEKSTTILHCIPLESFAGPVQYDVLRYRDQIWRIPPMVTGSGFSSRINLDGLAIYSGPQDDSLSYTQLFRNGVVEAAECYWLNVIYEGNRTIPYLAVEKGVLESLQKTFGLQKEIGVNPPIVVALTLTGTKGLRMASDAYTFDGGYAIAEENLILTESVVESFEEPAGKVLKPIFDLIWNACGYAETKTLDNQGNWIYSR
jgi:hypothetical protein